MSAIKKMNEELAERLGREPDIYEQIDMLIFAVIRDRLMELSVLYQVDKSDEIKQQYEHVMKCGKMIQERNPEIFSYDDSSGDGYV